VKFVLIPVVVLTVLILFTDIYLVFLMPLDIGGDVDSKYGDVILVLGGGLKKGREIGYSTQERLELAVRLFKQKKRTIIISGGSLYKGSPAIKKITDFFDKYGIDQSYLRFEGKSQTTFDNFFYTHEMIDNMKFKEIIVSTSPYHQRRSRMILSYLGFTDFKIKKMERSEVYQSHSIQQRLRNWKLIIREYLAILKFKVFKR
jgi:uncharacterized SAM-binding protein YcdF (DUF218 family)